ncbi:MAG: hypothetical protein IJQ39_02495 [Thermoguttaceae bacterium]|nr:hypothetical protein [Thermoguttaceae bacterium]
MKKMTRYVIMLLFAGLATCCVSCNEPNSPKGDNNQTVTVPQSEPQTVSQPEKEETSTDVSEPDAVPQPKKEPSSTSVSITETVSSSQKDWETSFQKGNECVEKGNIRLATFYYVNALGKDPGNMTVIQKYREVIENAINKSTNVEEKFSYYTALESFLQNQISTVPVDKVEQISQWLGALAAERDKLENDTVSDSGSAEEADDVADDSSDTFDELKSALEKLEASVRQSLDTGLSNPAYLDIASYQLQECEQIMRSIIAMAPQLDQTRQESVAVLYAGLKQLGEEVVDHKSKVLWDAFYVEHQKFVKEFNGLSFASNYPSTYGDGNMEKRLKLIQKEMAKLQALLPKLSEKYVGDMSIDYAKDGFKAQNASALIQQMQLWLKESSEKQMQSYNQWAVNRIKTANDEAYKAIGWVANGKAGRETIANALIDNLGPIDTRFMTSEVNRCYQEVLNKYLASNQLNPVKDEKSWTEQGNMGHTLLKMFEMSKVQPSQF